MMSDKKGKLFLFELLVNEFKSKNDQHDFGVVAEFSDVFDLTLRRQQKSKKKRKIKKERPEEFQTRLQMNQAILLESSIENLKEKMKNNPLNIKVQAKDGINIISGSTEIPWTSKFTQFLSSLPYKQDNSRVSSTTKHKIYDSWTSKLLATIDITIKLCYFRDSSTNRPPIRNDQEAINKDIKNVQINDDNTDDEKSQIRAIKLYPSEEKIETAEKEFTHEKELIVMIEQDLNETAEKELHDEKKCDLFDKKEISVLVNDPVQETPLRPGTTIPIFELRKTTSAFPKSTSNIFREPSLPAEISRSFDSIQIKNTVNASKFMNPFSSVFCYNSRGIGNTRFFIGCALKAHAGTDTPKREGSSSSIQSECDSDRLQYKFCEDTCGRLRASSNESEDISIDLPNEAKDLISVTKCKVVDCENRLHRKCRRLHEPTDDDRTVMIINKDECCKKVEDEGDPCYCTCECKLEYGYVNLLKFSEAAGYIDTSVLIKQTTGKTVYCDICGGYETLGNDLVLPKNPCDPLPFPCPIFHKLDRKGRSSSTSCERLSKGSKGSKSPKGSAKGSKSSDGKSKKNRFKFRVGYEGIPYLIGRDDYPNTVSVPKNMGWLWTAKDIPGMKPRPDYKPGCCHKKVVHLLQIAKNPDVVLQRQRRKLATKKKPVKHLLSVEKKEGDFTIAIETMKKYNKPRLLNQQPFEDQPPLCFTVGKTREEKLARERRKARRVRLLEYDQREFIQSSFRNMCHKICKRILDQALNLMPSCYPEPECKSSLPSSCEETPPTPPECTCEECELSSEDTDNDEWAFTFSPPIANFRPQIKKTLKQNKTTQYCYLDYRVKITDPKGNPIPRFFIGPDGKQECSDLGGFWGPDKTWIEINVDGFIAKDGRWAPYNFTGPGNEPVTCTNEKFQLADGTTFVIGEDGYIENDKWKFYKKNKEIHSKHKKEITASAGKFRCYGDVSPHFFTTLGITGHGHDKKVLSEAAKRGAEKEARKCTRDGRKKGHSVSPR